MAKIERLLNDSKEEFKLILAVNVGGPLIPVILAEPSKPTNRQCYPLRHVSSCHREKRTIADFLFSSANSVALTFLPSSSPWSSEAPTTAIYLCGAANPMGSAELVV